MLFERFAIDVLNSASNKKRAAELLDLSWDELHHIQEGAVERGLSRRKLDQSSHLGIDEKSFLKGHSYASILYDLYESRVLDVVEGQTEDCVKELLQTIPENKRGEIKAVAVDMWPAFILAIQSVLPNAAIVHDKYHIVSHLNTVKILQKDHLKVGSAWLIKESFSVIWDYTYNLSTRNFFKRWYYWATHSRLKPIMKVAKMLKKHLDNILIYLRYPITNAKAGEFNSKIQSIKSAARGFGTFNNYRTSILFYCGGLDMYP